MHFTELLRADVGVPSRVGHQGGEGREVTRVKLGSPTLKRSVVQRRRGLSSAPQSI